MLVKTIMHQTNTRYLTDLSYSFGFGEVRKNKTVQIQSSNVVIQISNQAQNSNIIILLFEIDLSFVICHL